MEQMLVTVDLIQKVISTVMAMAISFNWLFQWDYIYIHIP